MPFDDRTGRDWPLPHADNHLEDDVERLRDSLTAASDELTATEARAAALEVRATAVEGRADALEGRADDAAGRIRALEGRADGHDALTHDELKEIQEGAWRHLTPAQLAAFPTLEVGDILTTERGKIPVVDLGPRPIDTRATVPETPGEWCVIAGLGLFHFDASATNVTDGETCIKGDGGSGRWWLQASAYDLVRRNDGRMEGFSTEAIRVYDHILRAPAGAADLDSASTTDAAALGDVLGDAAALLAMTDDYAREEQLISSPGAVRVGVDQNEWIDAMTNSSWGMGKGYTNDEYRKHWCHRVSLLLNDKAVFEATLGSAAFWNCAAQTSEYTTGLSAQDGYPTLGVSLNKERYKALLASDAAMEGIFAASSRLGDAFLSTPGVAGQIATDPASLKRVISLPYGPTAFVNNVGSLITEGGTPFLRSTVDEADIRALFWGMSTGKGMNYATTVYPMLSSLGWTKKDFKYVASCTQDSGEKTAGWSGTGLAFISILCLGVTESSNYVGFPTAGLYIDGQTSSSIGASAYPTASPPNIANGLNSASYFMAPADGWSVWVNVGGKGTTARWCAELWVPPTE